MPGRRKARAAAGPARGFALLIVLWTMVLLALLVTGITAAGRSNAELAANLRGRAEAAAAADGAVQIALFRALAPAATGWPANGAPHRLRIGTVEVTVTIINEGGLINPNTAPLTLLVALLRRLGVDPAAATSLGAAIVDWRSPGPAPSPHGAKIPQYRAAGRAWGPPGGPFQSTGELALVLGMTPALAARLEPYLSVYAPGSVNPALAGPLVRAALADANGGILPTIGVDPRLLTLRVTARAVAGGGARFTRSAVLGVDPAAGSFETLAWQEGRG